MEIGVTMKKVSLIPVTILFLLSFSSFGDEVDHDIKLFEGAYALTHQNLLVLESESKLFSTESPVNFLKSSRMGMRNFCIEEILPENADLLTPRLMDIIVEGCQQAVNDYEVESGNG